MASEPLAAPVPLPVPKRGKARRSARRRLAIAVLLAVPVLVLALEATGSPLGTALRDWLSLATAARRFDNHLAHVLLIPFGALLAVFFRLTLGIRVLGPFRSALLGVAFLLTGLPVGLTFVTLVLATVVATRPLLAKFKLPNYARLSATLSVVAIVIALTLLVGRGFGWHALHRAAYFPLVALSLTADGFAAAWRREGRASALWRGAATIALGVVIALLAGQHAFSHLLLSHPELLLAEVALMFAIAEFFGFRSSPR
ncbi:MAG: 7TM domain-containing protein [Candidatus Eisenbacteria bacterium]